MAIIYSTDTINSGGSINKLITFFLPPPILLGWLSAAASVWLAAAAGPSGHPHTDATQQ